MILLINPDVPPDSPWGLSRMLPPLGLAYIAATLEEAGFKVSIHDNYLLRNSIEEIKSIIMKANPDFVGISCNSINYWKGIEIARAVKDVNPECCVILGGPHPTCMPEGVLRHREVDYVVLGEGEHTMLELVNNYRGNSLKELEIPGIAHRKDGGICTHSRKFIDNLDQVPMPARHLLQMQKYDRKIEYIDTEPVDILNVVRGCPFNCKFCETKEIWGSKSRYFSPARVCNEVEHLMKNYGTKGVYFIGDNFTIDKRKTEEICCAFIKRGLDIKWACDTRVDLLNEELLNIMKKSGCETIWFGVESGSPRILQKINKGITIDQIINAFKLCRKVGIKTACSFLMGIPGETIDDMKASLELAKKLDPDWCQFNVYIAVPGSELYNEVIREKLYSRMDGYTAYVKTEDFSYETVLELQKTFHKKIHRTPKRIIKGITRKIALKLFKS